MTWKFANVSSKDFKKPKRPDPLVAHHMKERSRATFKVLELSEDMQSATVEVTQVEGLMPGRTSGVGSIQQLNANTGFLQRASTEQRELLRKTKVGTEFVVESKLSSHTLLPQFNLVKINHPKE